MSNTELSKLINLILPKELTEYFTVTAIDDKEHEIELFLEENNTPPEGYKKEELLSKGFYEPTSIQDFPLRDRPVFLNIKRRRWEVKATKQKISRDWNTVAHGTKLTQEFADFLKELYRLSSHK